MDKLLIGVLSCEAYSERRARCLRTWIPEALALGMDVVFLIGGSAESRPRREGLNLFLPCRDDYESLPAKVAHFLSWAAAHSEYDYVFKCDDDTYLRPDRLLAFDRGDRDYIGAEWSPGVGYASGGAGYFLSHRCIPHLAQRLSQQTSGAEDVLVGSILSEAGISFQISNQFVAFGNDELRPRPSNSIISTHACDQPWKAHDVEFGGGRAIVTCRPAGRLGNQMFQVAAVLGFAARTGRHEPIFQRTAFQSFSETAFRRLRYSEIPQELVLIGDAPDFGYQTDLPQDDHISYCVTGYMQSEKYFSHCPDIIRHAFEFPPELQAELLNKYRSILGSGSASVHVRRTDFQSRPDFHPLLPLQYYQNAIDYLDQHARITSLICFSDDPEWCQHFLIPLDQRLTLVHSDDPYRDLALMSLCEHHIIANSSFSWWGAWLGRSTDKIVVAPENYLGSAFVGYTDRDLIPDAWVRISTEPSCEAGASIHPNGFWLSHRPDEHHAFDQQLCMQLIRFFCEAGGTVADFGCGPGHYVREMRLAGIACDGFDGNPATEQFTNGQCSVLDLSLPVNLKKPYDWVLSLEVGEHIPERCEQAFLDNLDRHNASGVILSWAIPGQGGHGHVNERSNEYVAEQFRQRGYARDMELEARLRQSVSNCGWFRNTILVFRREPIQVSHSLTASDIRRLVQRDDPVMLELGCNDGIDSLCFLNEFPSIRLHCFEPDPRAVSRFGVRDDRCTLHQIAIAESDGERPFYLSSGTPPDGRMEVWDLSSSLRRPTAHLDIHPWCRFDTQVQVQTRSLDSWFFRHSGLDRIDFIWSDIQGAEGEMIRGGRETLRNHVRYLYTECYDTPMYDGQPTRKEILTMLPEYECLGIYEGYNILLRNRLLNHL